MVESVNGEYSQAVNGLESGDKHVIRNEKRT